MSEKEKLKKKEKTKGQITFDIISYLLALQNEPSKWTKKKDRDFKNESAERWVPLDVALPVAEKVDRVEELLKNLRGDIEELKYNIELDKPTLENGYYLNQTEKILGQIEALEEALKQK